MRAAALLTVALIVFMVVCVFVIPPLSRWILFCVVWGWCG